MCQARFVSVDAEALFCPTCGGYVHPFLDPCPRCGRARASRYDEVAGGATLDLAQLCADPDTLDAARSALRSGAMAGGIGAMMAGHTPADDPVDEIAALLAETASRLQYRAVVRAVARGPATEGKFELDAQRLVVRSSRDRSVLASVPLARVLGVTPLGGRFGEDGAALAVAHLRLGAQAAPESLGGDLVVLHATDDGLAQVALANPAGVFATKARPDHFRVVARWLGVVAGAAAERDWQARGIRRHAHDLGLRVEPEPPAGAGTGSDDGARDVRAALETLEGLRSAGLVTDAEYEAKRREILARL